MRTPLLAAAFAAIAFIPADASASDISTGSLKDAPSYFASPFWTGFYIGAHVGSGIGIQSLANGQSSAGPDTPSLGAMVGSGDFTGVLGGGQIGYNYQIGRLVLGVEGEISASGIGGHTLLHPFGAAGDLNSEIEWAGTLAGRIGVVFHGDTLYYVKGGLAWDENKYQLSATSPFASGTYPAVTDSRTGWLLGFGAEYAVAPCWSVKFEYDYINFGRERVAFPQGSGEADLTGPFTSDIDQKLHIFKVGINYKFGDYVGALK